MIFLIEYDRRAGQIVKLLRFEERDREQAANARLEIELELNRHGDNSHEVVLLEAATEDALRRTHRRYFEDAVRIGSTG